MKLVRFFIIYITNVIKINPAIRDLLHAYRRTLQMFFIKPDCVIKDDDAMLRMPRHACAADRG
jgi:hypothetical protein